MNQYKKYMDRQGVSPSLHARLTALAEGDGPAPQGRAFLCLLIAAPVLRPQSRGTGDGAGWAAI